MGQGLTEEMIEKLMAAESEEELMALAKEQGVDIPTSENRELTDSEVEAVVGGTSEWNRRNPPPTMPCRCGKDAQLKEKGHFYEYYCESCRRITVYTYYNNKFHEASSWITSKLYRP